MAVRLSQMRKRPCFSRASSGAIDDQLTAPLEQVEQADLTRRSVERVRLLDRAKRHPRFPGESAAYMKARQALLAEEIELRLAL